MEFLSKKLQSIHGLHKPLFFWDDTALIGTPAALSQAIKMLNECASITGLHLKWKKCHLHGLPSTIEECNSLSFPRSMALHTTFNMEYLKAPIGDNDFVRNWLEKKTKELRSLTSYP